MPDKVKITKKEFEELYELEPETKEDILAETAKDKETYLTIDEQIEESDKLMADEF